MPFVASEQTLWKEDAFGVWVCARMCARVPLSFWVHLYAVLLLVHAATFANLLIALCVCPFSSLGLRAHLDSVIVMATPELNYSGRVWLFRCLRLAGTYKIMWNMHLYLLVLSRKRFASVYMQGYVCMAIYICTCGKWVSKGGSPNWYDLCLAP